MPIPGLGALGGGGLQTSASSSASSGDASAGLTSNSGLVFGGSGGANKDGASGASNGNMIAVAAIAGAFLLVAVVLFKK